MKQKIDKTRLNRKKLKELIVLLLNKCGPMTISELSWTLYNCDMQAYAKFGKSITGATWVKGKDFPIACDSKLRPI